LALSAEVYQAELKINFGNLQQPLIAFFFLLGPSGLFALLGSFSSF